MKHCIIIAFFVLFAINIQAQSKPNIVFILADDWGWTDWEMNGDKNGSTFYETPNLNKLSQQGMFFDQAYVHPLCSPTRAALLTGKYPGARFQMHQAITGSSVSNPTIPEKCNANMKTCFPGSRNNLPVDEITLAEELKKAGYSTHHFGKWHLGNSAFFPKKQGFDTQFAVGGAGPGRGGYFAPYIGLADISQGEDGEYITERLTEEVCKRLEEVKDESFFIYFAHYNVHSPYQGKADLVNKYDAKALLNPDNKHQHPTMGAMVESLDASVGQVMQKLEDLGLSKNTLFVVMGDNGGIHWANDKNEKYKEIPITSNSPLRAGKACCYEGGVRVPLFVKQPGLIRNGAIEHTPVHIIDFYPTILEWVGAEVSSEKDVYDGVSIAGLLRGESELPDRPIFCHFPRKKQIGAPVGASYIRMGNYKLYRLYGDNNDATDRYELYNIKKDISEQNDSISFMPELADSLKLMLDKWLLETGALVPHKNPDWTGASNIPTDAPTNLNIFIENDDALNLYWTDNSEEEKNFVIERSIGDNQNWNILDTVPANYSEYFDENIDKMQYHFYRIHANYGDSVSDYSEIKAGRLKKKRMSCPPHGTQFS